MTNRKTAPGTDNRRQLYDIVTVLLTKEALPNTWCISAKAEKSGLRKNKRPLSGHIEK
jgi:hypothetical protein